ncbi:MAG: ACP phosphodiesterase [Pseudomonadales bacterium]
MNHLAHQLLSGNNDHLRLGGFLGDFVKGRQIGTRPAAIERGIQLHRAIDAYTDQHPAVTACRLALPDDLRRVSGIVTDIAFDHFLAKTWTQYHHQSLQRFDQLTFENLLKPNHHPFFPEQALLTCQRMRDFKSLLRTQDDDFISRSLIHIGTRLRGGQRFFNPKTIARMTPALPLIAATFPEFFACLQAFVDNWLIEADIAKISEHIDPPIIG